MIGEAEVSKVLRLKGIFASESWTSQAIAYLRNQGPVGVSAEAVAEKVFALYLQSDIYDSCDYGQGGRNASPGLLPGNLSSKHKVNLAQDQAIVLQIDEITNIGSSLDQQGQEANRYLKLFLTDGVNFVVGLEHKRVNDLRLNIPAGTKVLGGEVGRLMDLAKLYAPPEEEQQPHILDERQPVRARQPIVEAQPPPQHQQQQQQQQQPVPKQQQLLRKPLEVSEPSPAAPNPNPSPAANFEPAPAMLGTPEDNAADVENFPYPDAIELLDDSQGSENFPARPPVARGTPQVFDLTGSGPSSPTKDASTVQKQGPTAVEDDADVQAMPFPAADDPEQDDLLGTPPGPAATSSNGTGGGPVPWPAMPRETPLPVISPLARLAEEQESSQEDRIVYIRGHCTAMEKFKVRKAKGDKDKDKSQSPLKSQDQPEFEVHLHFDDGSTVYKMLRVHPALSEKQIGITARAYQEGLEARDEEGASEYKRSAQMKFATFQGIFRCEWKKSRKKKKKGGTPDPLELEAVEQVEDPVMSKALTKAMLKAQSGQQL